MMDEINKAKTDEDLLLEALKMSLNIPWRTPDHRQRLLRMINALEHGAKAMFQ